MNLNDTNLPTQCNCLLPNSGTQILCTNKVKYMVRFETGEHLYSCGISSHISYISMYVNTLKKGNLYIITGGETFDFQKSIDNSGHGTMYHMKDQINKSYHHWRVMNHIPNHKSEFVSGMENTLSAIRMKSLNSTDLGSYTVLMDLLQKQINSIRYYEHLETHVAILLKFNLELNIIYKKGFAYCLPISTVEECSICTENITNVCGGNLPCGHGFHNNCITPWFRNKNTCPNCRSVIKTHLYRSVYIPLDQRPT